MRAIIIEEARFEEFTRLLENIGTSMKQGNSFAHKPEDITQVRWEMLIDEIRRAYHYEFVHWAQSHGASCTR